MQFQINQVVYGKRAGMFQIDAFDKIMGVRGYVVKELNPSTGERGPYPALFMTAKELSATKPLVLSEVLASEIAETIRPFAEAKVHNPNRSEDLHTQRTINVPMNDIIKIRQLLEKLGG